VIRDPWRRGEENPRTGLRPMRGTKVSEDARTLNVGRLKVERWRKGEKEITQRLRVHRGSGCGMRGVKERSSGSLRSLRTRILFGCSVLLEESEKGEYPHPPAFRMNMLSTVQAQAFANGSTARPRDGMEAACRSGRKRVVDEELPNSI